MSVRAKFYCQSIQHVHAAAGEQIAIVKLGAAFGSYAKGDDDGNKDWSKYTPQGTIEMTVTNPAAIEQFALGECYFIDFTPAT